MRAALQVASSIAQSLASFPSKLAINLAAQPHRPPTRRLRQRDHRMAIRKSRADVRLWPKADILFCITHVHYRR
jgi:hypothetical protein